MFWILVYLVPAYSGVSVMIPCLRLPGILEREALFHRIQIGNEDLIYKLVHGYQCYASGSYGTTNKTEYEGSSWEYIITKTMWRTYFLSRGTVAPAESFNT